MDYRFKDKAKDAGADPWGYFYRECVSFVASRWQTLVLNLVYLVTSVMVTNGYLPACHT